MRVMVSKNGTSREEGMEAVHLTRTALILSLSIFGVALAYFGALYLIAH